MEATESTHKVRGFCALCTAHCATIATVTDGKVVRLEADADHPNGGVFCLKGKAAPELVYHPDRLNYPLKRTRPKGDSDPGWQRVSWDEALDDIAQRLIAIRERDGARAVALAKGTGGGTSVSDAERWLARLLNRFGSPNWTSTTHVCNWHKDTGFTYTFGVEIPTPDVAHSGAFLLWGHNPSSTSLILAHDIVAARKRGMKIVAVDPRRVGIAAQADVLLQVRPGTDGALALAMIDVAITEKLFDDGFVRQWTNGSFLIRLDTGAALTEADLTESGSSNRFVAWDEIANAPILYDSSTGSFDRQPGRLSIAGARTVIGKDGAATCLRAGVCPLDRTGGGVHCREIIIDYLGSARQSSPSGAPAGGESAGQYVYAQRCRPAYQRDANQPGDRHVLCAIRRLRPAGRQCGFS